MTEARRKPGFLPTVAVAVATFAVLFEFLAFQLSSGNDPALGASALQVASTKKAAAATRPVIDRKVIKTKVVHHPPKPAVSSSAVPVSSGSTSSVTPTTSPTSAPAPVATPAPAPAPAPAPTVTATS